MKRLALISVCVAAGSLSFAQVNYSTNFDSMALGALAGQDGWVTGSGATNLPTVTNNNSLSSPNSVLVGYPGTNASFNSVSRAFAAGLPTANTRWLTASGNIFVNNVAGADRYFGIGFGTGTLATQGWIGIALGGNGLRGGGGSYASYNSLAGGLLQARTTTDFVGRWVGVSLIADRSIATNNVTFRFTNLGTSGGNSTEVFVRSVNFAAGNLSHAQIFNDWGSSSTVQGSANIDNVVYGANPVPEPASMAALGLGVVALMRRRKAKKSA